MSESTQAQKTAESILNLMLINGMTETMAQNIYQSGFSSVQALGEADTDQVMGIAGYGEEAKAQKLIDDATALIAQYKAEGKVLPTVSAKGADVGAPRAAQAAQDAKSQAEERLKAEMAQLSAKKENE